MDNVRDELIGILRAPIFPHELADPTEAVADYLLDNGVTIMRWIPVTKRLPSQCESWIHVEDDLFEPSEFIVFIEGAEIPTVLCFNGESFRDQEGNHYRVSHWMPMPEPPKEE